MAMIDACPYMEENAERIEKLCREGMELCSGASDLLLSCSGGFACWDTLAETGGEKHPEQFAISIADLLVAQDKVTEALVKAREIWRLLQEKELCAAYLSALLEIAERKEGGKAMEENISFFVQDIYDETYEGFQKINNLSSLICNAESADELTWQKREKAKETARGAAELLSNAEKNLQEIINML